MSHTIRSAKSILALVGKKTTFHFSTPVNANQDILTRIGFTDPIANGMEIIPKGIGKFTTFNANGKEIIRDDLPKETVYKMIWGTTRDWHGNLHSQLQNRKFSMYPREWIEAPEESLKIITKNGEKLVISRSIQTENEDKKNIIHLANIFLEAFGGYNLINEDLTPLLPYKTKKLNWQILPPGEHPFEKITKLIDKATNELDKPGKRVAGYRISSILSHKPDFIAMGNGGFHGYMVMGFSKKNLYVLESPIFGNATYIFKGDWENLSKLTKKDIVRNSLQEYRLVHSKSWRVELRRILDFN
ncbi:hypothetical protein ACUXVY_13735 [Chromobacterium haemolyticum]|uniref:hypothetical protein n=1 Tax=Chromobacterium haemolyticum TaxID=394935 RepID=UPI00405763FC